MSYDKAKGDASHEPEQLEDGHVVGAQGLARLARVDQVGNERRPAHTAA